MSRLSVTLTFVMYKTSSTSGHDPRPFPAATSVVVLALALLLPGCSDTSFVGKRVDNFTAYYNTFYNAQESFDEGLDRALERQAAEPVDMNVYLDLFLTGQASRSSGEGPFTTTIEKSANVLRDHPNSKWVDESLMLIGKSYYFQQNYVGAEQKFREVQGMGTRLNGEARFWLVRTLVASNRLAEAEEVSTSVLGAGEPSTWTARTWLARGEALVRQERWADADQALATGLSGDLPGDLRARAAFLLGQVRETLGDPQGAQSAYRRSFSAGKEYELEYAARLSAIRVQGRNGEAEAALEELQQMERDDKNFERLSSLRVLRGRLLVEANRPEEAQSVLQDVLYDETPAQGTVRGRAHYALGELYRDTYEDFTLAAAHFDTASTSLDQAVRTDEPVLLAPAAITDSRSISERFVVISDRAAAVARMDSLLALGALPQDSLRSRLLAIQETRREEQAEQQERRDQQEAARRFNTRTVTTNRDASGTAAAASGRGAFLFYDNPARVQEGRRTFQRRWGNRPRVDNWRRSAVIEQQRVQSQDPDPVEAGEGRVPVAGAGPEDAAATTLQMDVSEIPRTPDEQAAMRSDRAVAQYELATALFLNASRPDSAATWYRRIIEEDENEATVQQSVYALAEVRRSQGQDEVARQLYVRLIRESPNSPYAQRARQRLGRVPVEVADSNAVAEAMYASAYRAWQSTRLDSARMDMARVARVYPESHVAPRAVLALATLSLDETRRLLKQAGVRQPARAVSETTTPSGELAETGASTGSDGQTGTSVGESQPGESQPAERLAARRPSDTPSQASTKREAQTTGEANTGSQQDDRVIEPEQPDDGSGGTKGQEVENGARGDGPPTSKQEEQTSHLEVAEQVRAVMSRQQLDDDFLKDIPAADSLVNAGRDQLRDALGQNEPVQPRSADGSSPGPDSEDGVQARRPSRAEASQGGPVRRASGAEHADHGRANQQRGNGQPAGQVRSPANRNAPAPKEDSSNVVQGSSLRGLAEQEPGSARVVDDSTERFLRDEAASVRAQQQRVQTDTTRTDPTNTNPTDTDTSDTAAVDAEGELSADAEARSSFQRRGVDDPEADSTSRLASGGFPDSVKTVSEPEETDAEESKQQSSPVAEAYEPALNILAYLIARYPDSPQSERARVLAITLVEKHRLLPPRNPDVSAGTDAAPSESASADEARAEDPSMEVPSTEVPSTEESPTGRPLTETPPANREDGDVGSGQE